MYKYFRTIDQYFVDKECMYENDLPKKTFYFWEQFSYFFMNNEGVKYNINNINIKICWSRKL